MVEFDSVVQRRFVVDAILLSVIVLPLYLEGTRGEPEAFLDLKNAFSVRMVQ